MKRIFRGVSATALTFSAGLLAQSPAAEAPRVRSAAALTLVEVDVVVTRKDGTPVEGLTAGDFVVTHDGRPVSITNFREEKRAAPKSHAAASGTPAAPVAAAAGPAAPVSEPAPVPAPPVRARRHLLFFVDDLALPDPRERAEVFDALKAIATRTMEPGDDAMIVTWRRGIRRAWPFTTDLALLGRRLDAVARDARQLGQGTRIDLDQLDEDEKFYLWSESNGDSELSRNRLIQERWLEVKSKLAVLKGLVASMSGLEGRKVLVLVSRRLSKFAGQEFEVPIMRGSARQGGPGFLGDVKGLNTKEFIDALTDAANAAGVTIHSLYAEGWTMDVPTASNRAMSPLPDRFSTMLLAQTPQTISNEMTTLGIVSERTGGVVVGSTMQASRFAERVASDLSHWYSIGYPRPGGDEASGKIVVKAKKPGLVVRSRKAFVDRPPGEVMRERVVANLFRRDEAAKLPIGVEAGAPVAKEKGLWVTTLRVRVPVRSLALLPDGEEAKGAVTLYRVSATPVGEVSDVRMERQEVRVPAALATPESAVALDYAVEVESVDPASRISVGVLDATSGDAGFRLIRPAG